MREEQSRDIKTAIERGHAQWLSALLDNAKPPLRDYALLKYREVHAVVSSTDHLHPLEVLDVLIAAGAPIDSTYSASSGTLLADMAAAGKTALVGRLLQAGARVDGAMVEQKFRTRPVWRQPLSMAAYHGHGEVVELLLGAGADPNHPDERGRSALWWAADHGHVQVMEQLRQAGADPARLDDEDCNLSIAFLTTAASMPEAQFRAGVRWLVEQGVDLNHAGAGGSSFLESLHESPWRRIADEIVAHYQADSLQRHAPIPDGARPAKRL